MQGEIEWECNGVTLRGEDHPGDGPSLVFVHGWCCDRSFLAPQVEFFAKQRSQRVVSLDLRGHGQSTGHDSECTIEQFAADVASVIEQCGLDRPTVVGHSMGGVVALELAMRRPELVASIAMLDSWVAVHSHLAGATEGLSLLLDSPRCSETIGDFVGEWLLRDDTPAELRTRALDTMMAADPSVALQCWSSMNEFDDRGAIKACPVPILFMAAENKVTALEELPDMNPGLELVCMRGVSHFHPVEAPDATNRHLADFLDRLKNRR
jgi:pimeloyl-ACP methyl ester carboxylesterase